MTHLRHSYRKCGTCWLWLLWVHVGETWLGQQQKHQEERKGHLDEVERTDHLDEVERTGHLDEVERTDHLQQLISWYCELAEVLGGEEDWPDRAPQVCKENS